MDYDFTSLLPADFEDLTRDLVGRYLSVRFEAFGPGPDGGIDGRHSTNDGDVILQAKHYAGSSNHALAAAMRKERASIDKLRPKRYLLATSRHLNHSSKSKLAEVIGPALLEESDILARGDLNHLLRRFGDIERTHIKLWLSSSTVLAAVLEAIVHSGSHAFTVTSKAEIAAKVKVYAQNPSLGAARELLDKRHVLIISGPPGVGKTTLAEILSFAYLSEGWELVALRTLEDGFDRIDDLRKQIFFFDDFLGAIALDERALAEKDNQLARFMTRVRSSPNARFILTTRAYILNEAKLSSERLSDRRVELSTYVLDLSAYTRAIRARILYNHLALGRIDLACRRALIDSGKIGRIVDHKNYNPRVIDWMTDIINLDEVEPEHYAAAFLEALDNPKNLWEKAFTRHIKHAGRHLLITLFFAGLSDRQFQRLRLLFEALHVRMCEDLGQARDPKDFENSLKHLEGSFIVLSGGEADFINPSVRDYLSDYLSDDLLIRNILCVAQSAAMARNIWRFIGKRFNPFVRMEIAKAALPVISVVVDVQDPHDRDLSNGDRLELLLDWGGCTCDEIFYEGARRLVAMPPKNFIIWRDAKKILRLTAQLRDEACHIQLQVTETLAIELEAVMIKMLDRDYVPADDLLEICEIVFEGNFSESLGEATRRAIEYEVDNIGSAVENLDSESQLDEHGEILRQLAPRAGIPMAALTKVFQTINERAAVIQAEVVEAADPDLPSRSQTPAEESFNDQALTNLFDSLR